MKKLSEINHWAEMKNEIIQGDALEVLKMIPDNEACLVLTDPPYGINMGEKGWHSTVMGGKRGCNKALSGNYKLKKWDSQIPSKEIFDEIFRVSKNQIIWGGNYFIEHLKNTPSMIVWDKDNTGNFADCEIAWTSHKTAVRKFKWRWNGMIQEDMKNKEQRFHPTQKPLELARWCIERYAKDAKLIIDPFGGSFTFARACKDFGIDYISCDLDEEYCQVGERRMQQQNLF